MSCLADGLSLLARDLNSQTPTPRLTVTGRLLVHPHLLPRCRYCHLIYQSVPCYEEGWQAYSKDGTYTSLYLTQQPTTHCANSLRVSRHTPGTLPCPSDERCHPMSKSPTLRRHEYPQAFFRLLPKVPCHAFQHFLKDLLDHIKQRCNISIWICFLL